MKPTRLSLAVAAAFALATVTIWPVKSAAMTPQATIPGLRTPGTLTFGTNFGYPPMEMYVNGDPSHPTGADVEIGREIARRLGLAASFVNVTDFSTIVPALQAHRYDAIISSLNPTPKRALVVNFITYLNAGQQILVARGNPQHITGLADLSGKSVAVQVGTVEVDSLVAENKVLAARHKPQIVFKTFGEDTTAVQQVLIGRFVADVEDSPVAAYNVHLQPDKFSLAGKPFALAPYAIAFLKSEGTLQTAVQTAFAGMRRDGTYKKILRTYGLSAAAL